MRKLILILLVFLTINCFAELDDIIDIAEDYLNLEWEVDSVNVYSHYVAPGDTLEGYTTAHPCDWEDSIGVTITGMPYHYGGKDSFTQWDNDYTSGTYGPGADDSHYSSNPPSSLWWAAGIDCAGLVGRCWEISESEMSDCGCSYLVENSHQITAQQVQPGDAFVRTAYAPHARLCYYRDETDPIDDIVQTIEATGDDLYNKVVRKPNSMQDMIELFSFTAQSLNEGTSIPGGNVSGTWTWEGCSYMINGDITIPEGSQLTIEAGVNIIFTGHYKFNVRGRLLAEGEEHKYIYFTAENDSSGWGGLRFYNMNTNEQDSSKVLYCKFENGFAYGDSTDINGGAIYLENSDILIDNCIISNNRATGGGGICIYNTSNPLIRNTIINNNTATEFGGGVFIWENCTPTFEHVCIYKNIAESTDWGKGGGVYCYDWCFPNFLNVTFYGNIANYDSDHAGGAIYSTYNGYPTLKNCILWDDEPQEIGVGYSRIPIVTYSNIEGGESGEGNINSEPHFVDAANNNFNIKWNSPCIDSGDPTLAPDPDSTRNDMGCYYYHQPLDIEQATNVNINFNFSKSDSINIDWEHGTGAIYYKIYNSTNPYGSFLLLDSLRAVTNCNLPLAADKQFYYVVSGNNRSGTKSANYNSRTIDVEKIRNRIIK